MGNAHPRGQSRNEEGSLSPELDLSAAEGAATFVQQALDRGTAVEQFVHFVQKYGVALIQAWSDHQRPFLVLNCDFKGILKKAVHPEELDENTFEALWQLWRGNCTKVLEPKDLDNDRRIIQDPEKANVIEMLQLCSAVCLLLPLNALGRMEELLKLYDFDFEGGFTRTALPIALSKAREGCSHLCGLGTALEAHLPPKDLEDLHLQLVKVAGQNPDNARGLVSPADLAPAIPPLLLSLGRQAAVSESLYRCLSSTIAVCRDDLLPETFPGALFLGRYRVISRKRPAGAQWFKRLTLIVEDLIERQQCAIKVLITQDSDSPQHSRTFMRGAALLSKIEHPAIPRVRSYGQTREFLFQIMDCLEGCTLASRLEDLRKASSAKRRRQSVVNTRASTKDISAIAIEIPDVKPLVHPPRALREGIAELDIISMLEGLCHVLSAVHAREIVHGDLSPNAVLLAGGTFRRESVRVLSWDQASWDAVSPGMYGRDCPLLAPFPQSSAVGAHSTSMLYMPPERCESITEGPTPAWDLYALGCLAFESMCLRPPFLGMTPLNRKSMRHSKSMRQSKSTTQPDDAYRDPGNLMTNTLLSDTRIDMVHRVLGSVPTWLEETLDLDNVGVEAFNNKKDSLPLDELIGALRKEHMEVQPPDTRGFFTSDDLVDIAERLMEKQPADRYADADALAKSLGRLREKLEALPNALKECLPHLGGQKMNTHCLDIQKDQVHALDDFTSRYLAKFATELQASFLKITAGEIPLELIRDSTTTELKLGKKKLTAKDILVLARGIDGLAGLKHLDLSANAVCHESMEKARSGEPPDQFGGLRALCAEISHMEHLQHLDFSANMLGSTGGVAVCTAVAHCIRLEKIKLPLCGIGDAGAKAMASSIPSMPALVSLDLSHCDIGDVGATYLATVFGKGEAASLRSVSLPANKIADDGGTALMSALESNFELLTLSLGDNNIPVIHHRAIERAVAFNNQYLSLKQRNDKFDGFGHSLMAEALQTWARGDMFIACRLQKRLRKPRDDLELSVARLILKSESNDVAAFLAEISRDNDEDEVEGASQNVGKDGGGREEEETAAAGETDKGLDPQELDPKDVELLDNAEPTQTSDAQTEVGTSSEPVADDDSGATKETEAT